jgi:hypothetical protein
LRHHLGLLHDCLCLVHLRVRSAQCGSRGVDLLLRGRLLWQAALTPCIGIGLELRRLGCRELRPGGGQPGRLP